MHADVSNVDAWVQSGIITPEQARLIGEFEQPRPRGSIVRDILGYDGATLVLIAGAIIVAETWGDMDRGARVLVAIGAAGALVAAGLALDRTGDPTARRLAATSLMLGAAPAGFACGLVVDIWTESDVAVAAGFIAAVLYSVGWYVTRRSWAQHIALVASVTGAVLSIGAVAVADDMWITGVALALVGTGWLVASSSDRLPPRLLAEAGGLITLGTGSLITVGGLDGAFARTWMAVWIATSLIVAIHGVRRDRMVLVAGGIGGLIIYVPWLLVEAFGEGIGVPLALLGVGATLITGAVILARRASST